MKRLRIEKYEVAAYAAASFFAKKQSAASGTHKMSKSISRVLY